MIFKISKRPWMGWLLHMLLVFCGIEVLLMLLSSFGINVFPNVLTTIPVRILLTVVFVCWLYFYIVCAGKFLFLYFCDFELNENSLVVMHNQTKKEYFFTEQTIFDGVQLSNLSENNKMCSLYINYILIGSTNLEMLINLLDRKNNRMPFQF